MDFTVTFETLQRAVSKAVGEVCKLLPDNEKKYPGGYFCFCDRQYWPPMFIVRIGELPLDAEERERCFQRCQEKIRRADFVAKGSGCIKTDHYFMSFAGGLPDLASEAVMLLVAWRLRLFSRGTADAIAQTSDNPFFLNQEWPDKPY